MTSHSPAPRGLLFAAARCVVRLLVRLQAANFRDLHAWEVQLLFAERYAEERVRGAWPFARFLIRTFTDLAAGVFATRRRAARHFSPPHSYKGDAMFTQFVQDVRFALRTFGKNPGFALLAALTLALGIGATTSIFSVVYGVMLRPLPYHEPERLVTIYQKSREAQVMSVTFPNYLDWRKEAQTFEDMGAVMSWNTTLTGAGEAERLNVVRVTEGLFRTYGAQPLLGRTFAPEEDRHGGPAVVVLSEAFWARRLHRDPQVLGKPLVLGGVPHTVIGVMPADFYTRLSRTADAYLSLGLGEQGLKERSQYPGIAVIARLKPGISLEQGQADMERIARSLAAQYESNRGQSAAVFPLLDDTVDDVRTALWVLLGAVGFVLLIACANVANLLLARAAGRQREIAVRRALGAGQARLVGQLMTEALLLSIAAGAAGVMLAFWATDLIVAMSPRLPRLADVRVDGSVLGFAVGVTLLTNLFFGLAPAWLVSRVDLAQAMREGARGSSRGHSAVRHGLLIAEVGFALVLVIGAGLTLQSFLRVTQADTGVSIQNVLTARISLTSQRYGPPESRRQFFRDAIERLKSAPGVEFAAAAQPLPLSGDTWFRSFVIEGEPFPEPGMSQTADNFYVTTDYFRAVNVPLLQGRYFNAQDHAEAAEVCIVDEEFARKHFPKGDAVGRRLAWGFNWKAGDPPKKWATIVGVVGHVKQRGADQESRLQIYNPWEQSMLGLGVFVIKTRNEAGAFAPQLRQAIGEVDSDSALYQVQPMTQLAARLSSDRRIITILLNVFALIALALASVGIYGVMSYTVAQRTQEIGIRVALGAQPADVSRLVLGDGARLVAAGLVIGVAAALAMSRALQGMLFGVTGYDPLTYAGVSAMLAAVALLACWLPARRATRVSPLVALRSE